MEKQNNQPSQRIKAQRANVSEEALLIAIEEIKKSLDEKDLSETVRNELITSSEELSEILEDNSWKELVSIIGA